MPKQSKLSAHDKTVQMAVGDLDSKRLQIHSKESGLVMVDVVNQLLYLAKVRVETAKGGAEIDLSMFGSQVELFTLLTLHDAGLLTDDEYAQGLVIAHKYSSTGVAERLIAMREMVAERIELLKPHWAERREAMASWKTQWSPATVGRKPQDHEAHVHPVAVAAE